MAMDHIHLSINNIGAKHLDGSEGRSIIACIAYRITGVLTEYEIDKNGNYVEKDVYNYSYKQKVAHTDIIAPKGSPAWVYDTEELWHKVKNAERRKDARYAVDMDFALPNEFTLMQNIKLVEEFVQKAFIIHGAVVQHALHYDNINNLHAHITVTTRSIVGNEFSKKKIAAFDKQSFIETTREICANTTNIHYANNGYDKRVVHESYERLGIDQKATIHEGYGARKLAKMGEIVDVIEYNKDVRKYNLEKIKLNPEILIAKLSVGYVKFGNKEISSELAKMLNDTKTESFEGDFNVLFNKIIKSDTLQNMRLGGEGANEFYYDSSLFKRGFTNTSAEEGDSVEDVIDDGKKDSDADTLNINSNETKRIVSKLTVELPKGSVFDDIKVDIENTKQILSEIERQKKGSFNSKKDDEQFWEELYRGLYSSIPRILPEFGFKRVGNDWKSTTNIHVDGAAGKDISDLYVYANRPGVIIDHARGSKGIWNYLAGRYTIQDLISIAGGTRDIIKQRVEFKPVDMPVQEDLGNSSDRIKVMNGFARYCVAKSKTIDGETKAYLEDRFSFCQKGTVENLLESGYISYYDKDNFGELCLYYSKAGIKKNIREEYFKPASSLGKQHKCIIPFRDTDGNAVGYIARDVTGVAESKYLYSKGTKRSHLLFNLDRVPKEADEVMVVEGMMDALSLIACGYTNVVALGSAAMNETQAKLLKDRGITKVKLCLDADGAGIRGTRRIIETLHQAGITDIECLKDFLGYKDANELLVATNNPKVIEQLEFTDIETFNLTHPDEDKQKKLSQEVLPQEISPQEPVAEAVEPVEINPEILKLRVLQSVHEQKNYFGSNKVVFTQGDIKEAVVIEAGVLSRKMRDEIYAEIIGNDFESLGEDGHGVRWLVRKNDTVDEKIFKRELERAADGGFTEDEIEQKYAELLRIPKIAPIDSKLSQQVGAIIETVVIKLSDTQTCFTEDEIRRAVAAEVEKLKELSLRNSLDLIVDSIITDKSIVKMNRKSLSGDVIYSTVKNIEIEKKTTEITDILNESDFGHIDNKHLEEILAQYDDNTVPPLNEVQKESIRSIVNGKDLVVIQGFPGTGKTTLLEVLNKYNNQYGRGELYGTSSYGIAALGMEEKSNINSRTFASLEKNNDYIKRGETIIVDEAGVLSNADYLKLVVIARDKKCKLVLLGDQLQTQSIHAGAMFAAIAEKYGATNLDAIVRQSGWQREASMCFAMGDFTAGLAKYEKENKVFAYRDNKDLVANVVDKYLRDTAQEKVIITNTNNQVMRINHLVHTRLVRSNLITDEQSITLMNRRNKSQKEIKNLSCGEQIVFLENDYNINVRNGTRGIIKSIKGNDLEVELSSGKIIKFNTEKEYGDIDYGYSSTIEKSQGSTFESVHAVIGNRNIGARRAFVEFTRHTKNLEIYYDQSVFKNTKALVNVIGRDDGKFNASRYEKTHAQMMDSNEYYRNIFYYVQTIDALTKLRAEIERQNRINNTSFEEEELFEKYQELFKVRSDLAFVICDNHKKHRDYLQEAGKVYRDNIIAHAKLKTILFEDEEKYEQELIIKYLQSEGNLKFKLADEITRARVGQIKFYEDEIYKHKIDFEQLKQDANSYAKLSGISYQNKLLKLEKSGYGTDKIISTDMRKSVIEQFNQITYIRDRVGSLRENIKKQAIMMDDAKAAIFAAQNFIEDCKGQEAKYADEIKKQQAKLASAQKELARLTEGDDIYKRQLKALSTRENILGRFANDGDYKQLKLQTDKIIEMEAHYKMMEVILSPEVIKLLAKNAHQNKNTLFAKLSKAITNTDTGEVRKVYDADKIRQYIEGMKKKSEPFKELLEITKTILHKESELKQIKLMFDGMKNQDSARINKRKAKLADQAETLINVIDTLKKDFVKDVKKVDQQKFRECASEYINLITAVGVNNLSKYGIGITKKHHLLLEKRVLTGTEYEINIATKQAKRLEEEITLKSQGVNYKEVDTLIREVFTEEEVAKRFNEEKVIDVEAEIKLVTEELNSLIKEETQLDIAIRDIKWNEQAIVSLESNISHAERAIKEDADYILESLKEALPDDIFSQCEALLEHGRYEHLEEILISCENNKEIKSGKILGMLTKTGKKQIRKLGAAKVANERIIRKTESIVGYKESITNQQNKLDQAKSNLDLIKGLEQERKVKINQLMIKLRTIQPLNEMDETIKLHFGLKNASGGFKMG